MKTLSPEFALAVECCRWPRSDAGALAVARSAEVVDWPLFHRVVHRHRVEGLVWDALRQADVGVPGVTAAPLARAASDIVRQNFLILAESLNLDQRLEAAGVATLFIKGLTLGMLAYGTVSLKRGWDIDIIVPVEQLRRRSPCSATPAIAANIRGRQERRRSRRLSPAEPRTSVWQDDRGFFVELHTALVDNERLLPGLDARAPSQAVELTQGRSLRTLARDELFAYLCVHGASSGWFRLKWIADLAAWLGGNSADENDRLYRSSQALGAGRAAARRCSLPTICSRLR